MGWGTRASTVGGWAMCLALAACGSEASGGSPDGASSPDAGGVDTRTPAEPAPPAPPALPEPPAPVTLAPCPAGWIEQGPPAERPDGATICEPFPSGDPGDCAIGERPEPGATGCVAIGPPSLAPGTFDPAIPDTAIFVDRGAAAGGDGTRARPFDTIAEGLAAAPAGGAVALAAGDYDERIEISREVTIRGSGLATRIAPSDATTAAIVASASATIEALSVSAPSVALTVASGANVELRGVELAVSGATAASPSAVALSGSVVVTDVAVRGGRVRVAEGASLTGARFASIGSPSLGIEVAGGMIDLSRSIVRGAAAGGVRVGSAGAATMSQSVIGSGRAAGVLAAGEDVGVTLRDVVVRDVAGTAASGVRVEAGATLVTERLLVERAAAFGVYVGGAGASATLDATVLRDDGLASPDSSEFGVLALMGGWIEASRISVEGCGVGGIAFYQSGGHVLDARVLDVQVRGARDIGMGILVGFSHATVRRAEIRGAQGAGVLVSDPGSQLLLGDVVVRATLPLESTYGRGAAANVQTGAKLTLERVAFIDSVGSAVYVGDQEATVSGADVTVRSTRPAPSGALWGLGFALNVQEAGRVDLERVAIDDSVGFAVLVRRARARLMDVTVSSTAHATRGPELGTLFGRAFDVQGGADVELARVVVEASHDSALSVMQESTLVARDLVVRDTGDDGVAGLEGRALQVYHGATARIDRARFETNRYASVSAHNPSTLLELFDVQILGTVPAACAPEGCEAGGIGLGVYDGARARAERFDIAWSALVGVQIATGGQLDLAHGVVRGSPLGANVQEPGYDFDRLSNDVLYVDNGANLDSAGLPVPAASNVFDATSDEDL